jgi:endonuclease/exonuclease/phosphatase (EEP) superfamily protein YafD
VDSFASVHAAPEDHPTWRWPTKIGEARLRIDYIFHTPSLSTVDSQVIKAEGSDHYLVVSQLRSASLANSAAATGGASREAAASPKR